MEPLADGAGGGCLDGGGWGKRLGVGDGSADFGGATEGAEVTTWGFELMVAARSAAARASCS